MRCLAVVLWALVATGAWGQLEEAKAAVQAENYQRAMELYRQAIVASPDDPAGHRGLAELFTNRGLHELALPEWKAVVDKAPGDPTSWTGLAAAWSYLDLNAESVRTLETAVERFPADPDLCQSLAWMLFKTEKFRTGIARVEAFQKEHGEDRGLEMTLGTLYSALYDYELSRVHYLKSLDLTPGRDEYSRNFRSVAWYNLSLLEKAFHQFDLADEAILKSIDEEDRPAGALARGELFQGRRDYRQARDLYQKAARDDTETPLGWFDLAELNLQAGRLDEAEANIAQVESHADQTWLLNYGVTKDKLDRDVEDLRRQLHEARFHGLDLRYRANPWDWAVWALDKVTEGLRWWYHDQRWKAALTRLADHSTAVGNQPDAWIQLTLANGDRPDLALKTLALMRAHEVPRNPRSAASYLLEEGLLRRDRGLLTRGLAGLQVPWENEDRERALAGLVQQGGTDVERRGWLNQLYAINPGALVVRGWALPVRCAVFGDPALVGQARGWWATVSGQQGWDAPLADRPGLTSSLDLRLTGDGVGWTLRDAEGTTVRSGQLRGTPGPELLSRVHGAVHEVR